jgi:glycosyltransferase involved in cell wall biosynthesis
MRHAVFISFYSDLIPRHKLMARTLADDGWRISVILWNRGQTTDNDTSEEWIDKKYIVNVEAGAGSPLILLKLPQFYARIYKQVNELHDLNAIFLTHYFLLPLALMLSSRSRSVLYDAPEYFCEDLTEYFGFARDIARPVIRVLERILTGNVDGISTIDTRNDWLKDYYERMNREAEIVWNIPALKDEPSEEELAFARQALAGKEVVTYVGSIKKIKGIDVVFQAIPLVLQRYPEVKFLFIGNLQEDKLDIETRIKSLGIEESVILKDFMPYSSMLAFLKMSTVALAVLQFRRNHLAGAGNCRKIFTYMQSGLPIVVSNVGSIGEFVDKNNIGISVTNDSVSETAITICKYLSNKKLAREHGSNGRSLFEEKYNWEMSSSNYLDFVKKCMSC